MYADIPVTKPYVISLPCTWYTSRVKGRGSQCSEGFCGVNNLQAFCGLTPISAPCFASNEDSTLRKVSIVSVFSKSPNQS